MPFHCALKRRLMIARIKRQSQPWRNSVFKALVTISFANSECENETDIISIVFAIKNCKVICFSTAVVSSKKAVVPICLYDQIL